MWYIVAFLILLLVGLLDGHTSSMTALFLLYILGFMSINTIKGRLNRSSGSIVFGIVFSVFIISAFISSRSFLNGQDFYVADSVKYIAEYGTIHSWSWNNSIYTLTNTYLFFADNNGLYNEGLGYWSYIGNYYFDGSSVFYLTMLQTIFGVLACFEIYKIFLLYFDSHKAAKYACYFALLSLFHIYSVVIIRDIVIAYFYMLGLRKVLGKPKISDIFVLLLVLVVTIGVRLFTGLFFGAFIMLWLYKLLQENRYARFKVILIPIVIVGIAFVAAAFASSLLVETTTGQLEESDELYTETSGFATRLRSLPMGVRQVAVLLFSQLPIDGFSFFPLAKSFSNYYLALLNAVFQLFGFVIFYGLMYLCFIKGFFKKLDFMDRWILIIMLVFIAITLSTHIDVRRSMEAIPFIYLYYMLYRDKCNPKTWNKVNSLIISIGFIMMFAYAMIRS